MTSTDESSHENIVIILQKTENKGKWRRFFIKDECGNTITMTCRDEYIYNNSSKFIISWWGREKIQKITN